VRNVSYGPIDQLNSDAICSQVIGELGGIPRIAAPTDFDRSPSGGQRGAGFGKIVHPVAEVMNGPSRYPCPGAPWDLLDELEMGGIERVGEP
jgi:hypothetical protein